ncbi:MAG: hypothetical protein IKV55_03465 [Oscillospiraceae bacterium]|nr:hypothetical protein [Oscillospiraceae bacterium]
MKNSSCLLATFPDAGHGLCYLVDAARYETVVRQFCTRLGLPARPLE